MENKNSRRKRLEELRGYLVEKFGEELMNYVDNYIDSKFETRNKIT